MTRNNTYRLLLFLMLIISALVSAPAFAQEADRNYVSSEVWLDSLGTNKVTSVQYYDGLGRPSVLAQGGVNLDGIHPCYNGNISSANTNYQGTWRGFNCEYDSLGRLTRAEGTTGEQMIPQGIDAMEELSYDANGNITSLSRYGKTDTYYGQTDNMQIAYTGNRITSVYDVVGQPVFAGSFGFNNGTGQYRYDKTGSLTCDGNRGIALIDYDNLGHSTRIQFTDGSVTSYEYTADGRRLKTKHETAVEGLTIPVNTRHELTNAETLAKDSTEYLGNFRYRNNQYDRYEFPGGYATPKPSYAVFDMDFHFYVQDHLGSNVMVLNNSGIEQQTRYYPFGGIVTQNSTNGNVNHNKYTGKEFDRMHGLDWYDYVARQYDPVYGRFTSIDPLCEKYPYLSPYAYCGNNPIMFVDPTGCIIDLSKMDEDEKKKYSHQVETLRNSSDLFDTMYHTLEESEDVYYVSFGEVISSQGDLIDGHFVLNSDGGGDVVFSKYNESIPHFALAEEMFHAYQHDNRNWYDSGSFNKEFEAKAFVDFVGIQCGGFPNIKGMREFQSKIESFTYGDNLNPITPQMVKSNAFLRDYYHYANMYAVRNIRSNCGNKNYKIFTNVAPYSLQRVVTDTYKNQYR